MFHVLLRLLKRQVDYRQDTTNGMPQCRHCKKMFLKWSSFNLHCRANVCSANADISSNLPLDWNWEDTVDMEPGPQHQEYHDRAMVFAVEADYMQVYEVRENCVTTCNSTAFCAPNI